MTAVFDLEVLIGKARASPLALANLASTLVHEKGGEARARVLCEEALALAPDDPEVASICATVRSAGVGAWYFSMVLDAPRHAAYARALERALAHGGTVLDIGAGTGLFAMMAARAGATTVYACERDPSVAEGARAVVARNGLQDRVRVIAKASTDLVLGEDLPEKVDMLLWDNLANNLVGAGAIPVIEDALRRLVKPGAQIMPARISVEAALAEDKDIGRRRMGLVEGFDLSPFNALSEPVYTVNCDSKRIELRSEPATIFDIDFRSGGPFAAERASREVRAAGGMVNGVVQWLDFRLDDQERFKTAPGQPVQAFGMQFHPMGAAILAEAGAPFQIMGSHDRENLRLWATRR